MSFLRVSGTKLVSQSGEIVLRGAGLGGWMTMENFITGYPGCEFQIREALAEVLGTQKAAFFFDKFLEYFFTDSDAKFFKSLGLNCIRIAINYRHFEDDLNPRVLKENAFAHLDRVVSICANHGIYTVIDMHTAPGGQNGGWHCDSGTHIPYFFTHKDFQDRLVWLWSVIASHYASNPWIAGYNLLNEPADPHPLHKGIIGVYDRLIEAVRKVDQDHIIFLDGNTYATDFTKFPDDVKTRWGDNIAFAIHDYSPYGFPDSKEVYKSTPEQKARMLETYKRKRRWLDERGLCVWNGEWGPVYARKEFDGEETDEINQRRYTVLKDQLEIYRKDNLSWSIWLYKDIGFQGMVHVSPSTPYIKLLKPFLHKKYRLAVDSWGADDKAVKHVFDPIVDLIFSNTSEAHRKLYPPLWPVGKRVTRIARNILVAEFLVKEWADFFEGKSEEELDEIAKSFLFENCVEREALNQALREDASLMSN